MKQEGKGDDGIKYFIIIMYGYIIYTYCID
jgi:hypothetical protein